MKKFLVITAILILLVILTFVGIFKYRQYTANQTLIPTKTTALIKVSVDEFYKTLSLNIISHIGYFLKPDEKESISKKTKNLNTGLKIPASIYFYAIEGAPKSTYFSRFQIKDFAEFTNFIQEQLRFQITKSTTAGLNIAASPDGKYTLLYNQKNAAVALSDTAHNVEQILNDVLNEKNFGKLSAGFEEIKNVHEHLGYIDKDYRATIDFVSGTAYFTLEFLPVTFTPAAKPKHRNLDSLNTVSMWLDASFAKNQNKIYNLKSFSVERDSLLKYHKNYLDFEWIGTTPQTDSIITYEFNDNFEKTQKVVTQTKDVPNFLAHIEANATELETYLDRQQLISQSKGIVNKAVFPLYKVFVKTNKDSINFSTKKNYALNTAKIEDRYFFSLYADIREIKKQIKPALPIQTLKMVKGLRVKGRSIDDKKVRFYGNVFLENDDINALYQILKNY